MERILLVSCDGLGHGGTQAVIMNIVRQLHDQYIFDIVLFTNDIRYYDEEFTSYGGIIYRIPKYLGNKRVCSFISKIFFDLRLKHEIKNILKNEKYKAVHCNNGYESAGILSIAKKMGVPIRIIHLHTISKCYNFYRAIANKFRLCVINKYANRKIACSIAASKSFFLKMDSKMNSIRIVYNPYDDIKFKNDFLDLNSERPLHLVQIGKFWEAKNQLFTIEVIHEISLKMPEVKMSFVGFGNNNYKANMENKISEYSLEQNISILEDSYDIPDLLSKCSALIMPSTREGFGIVLIEAQAMGVKCFASDVIPNETNCGGVLFLDLKNGPKWWANTIIQDYQQNKGKHNYYDTSRFKTDLFIGEIKKLYEER